MMMESQEVKAVCSRCEVNDLGLVGVQPQPELAQDRSRPSAGFFSPLAGRGDDDEIVGIPDKNSKMATSALPFLVERVQRDVGQQRRDRGTLRGPRRRCQHRTVLQHPRSQPPPEQFEHRPVDHPARYLHHQGVMVD